MSCWGGDPPRAPSMPRRAAPCRKLRRPLPPAHPACTLRAQPHPPGSAEPLLPPCWPPSTSTLTQPRSSVDQFRRLSSCRAPSDSLMERAPIDSRSTPELRARILGEPPLLPVTCLAISLLGGLSGCASIERGRYGVASLEFAGMQQLRSEPLRDCLLTRERNAVTLRLGASTPRCSEPPFTRADPHVQLWTWGWAA